ncbi:hypothetical protein [Nonomuraea glycinis]|uniref:hypothetical protein n=1 Tax=Nonomuraea glycinis TaxID=2047744 RepID=UPI002E13AAC0|nr:hypothetical protein OHA68_28070 [Nonomuraea glycinis]
MLLIVSSDHLNHYFAEVPTFGIGVAEETVGPCDRPDGLLPPVPSARRCFDIGRTIRESIDSADDGLGEYVRDEQGLLARPP